ncbi:biofilm regulation phosphoprotein SiaC [Thioalkalivibrio sp. ALE11]|uniref:biofilm regulation phosphoprotein SiaC n=1 Tax=Thioalkalivibrio sp. ALE11 TaxID=1265494 RepID=UPI0003A690D9|nr:biofilm regulation phosphoprotein SiaC [Thioalkalivibrio sp. ALE11]
MIDEEAREDQMTDLEIAKTQSTPSIVTDGDDGVLQMSGDSYPENSYEFFSPVIEWVQRQLDRDRKLRLELRLIYLNTSSVRAMLDIFDMLEEAHGSGAEVSVVWYYDPRNRRVADLAGEFQEDCSFPFEITAEEPA